MTHERLTLAYRIATMTTMVPPQWNDDDHVNSEIRSVIASPKFNFSNVAEFLTSNQDNFGKFNFMEAIPNWAPPFGTFFVEWSEPLNCTLDNGGVMPRTDARWSQVGHMCRSYDVSEQSEKSNLLAQFPGLVPNEIQKAKWLLAVTSTWIASSLMHSGSPQLIPKNVAANPFMVFIDKQGKAVVWNFGALKGDYGVLVLGLALSFMHCKNVVRKEVSDDRGERWHRRSNTPVFKYHVLDINPMRETLRNEGRLDDVGIKKALHICRGHFASYTSEKPLFGKYSGSFWRPDHTRGALESGAIVSDYRVRPN